MSSYIKFRLNYKQRVQIIWQELSVLINFIYYYIKNNEINYKVWRTKFFCLNINWQL